MALEEPSIERTDPTPDENPGSKELSELTDEDIAVRGVAAVKEGWATSYGSKNPEEPDRG